jgi:putative alpha-1,2-mannosidase
LASFRSDPASGDYLIGSPIFDRVDLHLANGTIFSVIGIHHSPTNLYIQAATLNGIPLTVPFINWAQIQAGGVPSFEMGPNASKWAAGWSATPL